MSTIRPLAADDVPAALRILAHADPSWRTNNVEEREQSRECMLQRVGIPGDTIDGLFHDEILLGITRLIRFHWRMSYRELHDWLVARPMCGRACSCEPPALLPQVDSHGWALAAGL